MSKPLLELLIAGIKFALVLGFVSVNALFLIWLERKVSARIQNRMGPIYVGRPQGWLQTAADALKLLTKEDIIPAGADRLTFVVAPAVLFTSAVLLFVVIPFGPGLIVRDLKLGVAYAAAVSGLAVISLVMAGWGSNNKYSLVGALRSASQMISYEVSLILAMLSVVILAGSLSTVEIVEAQSRIWFIALQPLGFLIYFIALLAELNRAPFDLPEAESELVAGYNTEYSGMRWAIFFLAEYANLFAGSALAVTLFLGGWQGPWLPPVVWFFLKTFLVIVVAMWLRWTLPRVRPDQLTSLGWKLLLPAALVNLGVTGFLVLAG
ncbi:MAG: NADH-quinone oxidoreductase subunit NuoH [Bacillota bacterium]|nr:NADH-quinone oxidoreductase subunit NuoH [Bacillota bacterium]